MSPNVRQVDRLNEQQTGQLCDLYQNEWWSKGRSRDDVQVMLANSGIVIGFVDGADRLVGFCRVLTDFVYRATIYDVIVAEAWRGQGLGRRLIDAVLDDSRLQRISRIGLFCLPELESFYEKWGFAAVPKDRVWMERSQREG